MENSRRDFFKKAAALTMGAIATSTVVKSASAATEFLEKEILPVDGGKFTLPALPYSYDALEPHIDKLTMEIHHSKHHQAYVNNLNKALETVDGNVLGSPQTLENIFSKMLLMPAAVRNNAGGHYNHSLFWMLMSPKGGGVPKGKLAEAIKAQFGSFDEFKKQFADAGMKRFGSGWAWLVKTKEGKLVISSTANQDNPLMGEGCNGTPILALDVWEHAYYLHYQNRRPDYIAAFFNIINWNIVAAKFHAAK